METQLDLFWKLLSSLGVGLLIGTERGWFGRQEDEGDRVAGIRTFSLVGLLGGISATFAPVTGYWILGVIFLAFTSLIITSYIMEMNISEDKDIGITTEVAILLTFLLGAWAGMGNIMEALGSAVAVMALLSMKPVLHKWLQKIEVEVIYAGIKLLVISLVLLPLLPDQGFGPWDTLNPYWIWWMVVLISGLSFIGYLLVKYLGENKGTILTSIIGGMASSTAVTISLAQFAKQFFKNTVNVYVAGVVIASSVMFVRVIIEVAVVNPELLDPLWIPVTTMILFCLIGVLWLRYITPDREDKKQPELELSNPLQLATAIKFGVILAVILVLSSALKEWFGDTGIYIVSLVSGLMDVDAITLSLSKMAREEITSRVATFGIVLAIISNTLVKAGLFVFIAGLNKSRRLIGLVLFISLGGILSTWLFL